jgi:hypothetical protein
MTPEDSGYLGNMIAELLGRPENKVHVNMWVGIGILLIVIGFLVRYIALPFGIGYVANATGRNYPANLILSWGLISLGGVAILLGGARQLLLK